MRKVLKRKRRSCAMCKPNKTGGGNRWSPRQFFKLRNAEKEIRESR